MYVLGALVLLLSNGCSAVFYSHDADFAYGLTAAHCVKKEGDVVNATWNGKVFGCRVISIDRVRDLALIKANRVHVGEVSCPITSAVVGERVALVGFPSGVLETFDGVVTDRTLFKGDAAKVVISGSHEVRGGFSGGGMFCESGLVGVVTHSVSEAGVTGAGCSIIDSIVNKGIDRASQRAEQSLTDVLPITNPGLRDLIAILIGWLGRFYLPGASMLTKAQHVEKLDAAKPR